MEQKAREAQVLIKAEKELAKTRMLAGKKIDPVAVLPQGTEQSVG